MPESPPLNVTYRLLVLNDSILKTLGQTYDSTQLYTVLGLNRIDLRKVKQTDTLVVPDTLVRDFNAYAPFPRSIASLDSVKKILLCSYPLEAFAAYERGRLVRWGPTSMGKKSTPTPTGLFHTNWKSKSTVSTDNADWILNWYFNLVNNTGVSLHQYELPGYPASHSCVRLREDDARWIYYWAEQWKVSPDGRDVTAYGTPVVIFGNYDYKQRAPWLKLAEGDNAFRLTEDSANVVVQPYVPTILQRQATRDSVVAALAAAPVAAK